MIYWKIFHWSVYPDITYYKSEISWINIKKHLPYAINFTLNCSSTLTNVLLIHVLKTAEFFCTFHTVARVHLFSWHWISKVLLYSLYCNWRMICTNVWSPGVTSRRYRNFFPFKNTSIQPKCLWVLCCIIICMSVWC